METTLNLFDPIQTLKEMIAIPSFSGEEKELADLIASKFSDLEIYYERKGNNVWAKNKHFDPIKKTILLNSHVDTVYPNVGYSIDPYTPILREGKLFGLGSNDAGGAAVALLQSFLTFYYEANLHYNLILLLSAEEENSGHNGIQAVLDELPFIEFAIVGEPTEMKMAIGEKGLLVLDVEVKGRSGHAAHFQNENAIEKAMKDLKWFQEYVFDNKSELLGPVKMTVTQINSGKQHNVVPDRCSFVVDIRVNEYYKNSEILEIIKNNVESEIIPRSTHLNSSGIPLEHPIIRGGISIGLEYYGSPTLSDQVHLSCPSLKIGPGKSERSHTANEFIFIDEIIKGIEIYEQLLKTVLL